jgi:glycosyltransferase involved in cell wall biosynthesis
MKIFVPRLIDEDNVNAQNLNARGMLSRFSNERCEWHCACYRKPDSAVSSNRVVRVKRVAPWRLWPWYMAMLYQRSADAIFYPGLEWFDLMALRLRDLVRRPIPVIATLEGLVGGPDREERLSLIAGHPVYCHRVPQAVLDRIDDLMHHVTHIVAISPFLARMAEELYGVKCSVLPMGVDIGQFTPSKTAKPNRPRKVITVGNVRTHKRPEFFLKLAERHKDVQFSWIGDGDERNNLIRDAVSRKLENLRFPGALTPTQVAEEMRAADIFVMPSRSEGVPKVTQEAAACGLPSIVFGYYETPTVVDGQNGYVVWSDCQFEQRLKELLNNGDLCTGMGRHGSEMAANWQWDRIATQWEREIISIVTSTSASRRRQ